MAASQPPPPDIAAIAVAVVNTLGSIVAILGIPITYVRLRRTNKAVEKTERTIANFQVLRLLPRFGTVELQFDEAVTAGDRDAAIQALLDWKSIANRLQGLLSGLSEHEAFRSQLKEAVSKASAAKYRLSTLKAPPAAAIERHTREFRAVATTVADAADVLETRLSSRSAGGLE